MHFHILMMSAKDENIQWNVGSLSLCYIDLLWLCSILMVPVMYGFNIWHNTFIMLRKVRHSRLIVPSLSPSYLCNCKMHIWTSVGLLLYSLLVYTHKYLRKNKLNDFIAFPKYYIVLDCKHKCRFTSYVNSPVLLVKGMCINVICPLLEKFVLVEFLEGFLRNSINASHHRTNGLSESNLFYTIESSCQLINCVWNEANTISVLVSDIMLTWSIKPDCFKVL